MSSLADRLRQLIKKRFYLFLNQRMPSCDKQTLSHKNIFILPTRFGLAFVFFVILLFVLGTNYQNNLILFISYLLSSLFVTAMLYCFFNMSGLVISAKGKYHGFCNQSIDIPVTLSTNDKRFAVNCYFQKNQNISVDEINRQTKVLVPLVYEKRGQYQLDRLTISSEYALGLFRGWTHLQFDIEVTVYPQPLACESIACTGQAQPFEQQSYNQSPSYKTGDDFYELRNYRTGDALSHVAWKQLAKSGAWLIKHNQQVLSDKMLLALDDMPAVELEVKLQHLCFLILQCHQQGIEFGIDLSGMIISPTHGEQHLAQCLTALSVYE